MKTVRCRFTKKELSILLEFFCPAEIFTKYKHLYGYMEEDIERVYLHILHLMEKIEKSER